MNNFLQKHQGAFQQSISYFQNEISSLRTGRANPGLLDRIRVETYGVKTPLIGLANVNVADGRSLIVVPWDKKIAKDIEKAITEENLGLAVVNEGDKLRLTMPMMNEENRREMVKKLNEKMEEARIGVRKVREQVKEEIEAAFGEKAISEDDKFRFIRELDEEVQKKNEIFKLFRDKKEKEIMTI